QDEFVGLFDEVLQRGYLALIGSKARITGGVNVMFIDEAVAGDVGVVRTAITTRSNGKLSIDYRMSRADGTWRVVDTIISGESLVANYREKVMRSGQRSTHREPIALMRSGVGKSTNRETAVALTPTDTMTSVGADMPVTSAVPTRPVEMTAVSETAPSAPAPLRPASFPANSTPSAAPQPAPTPQRGATVPSTTAPSLTLRSARRDPKRFWVQIGAFLDSESAAQLVERLADPSVTIITQPSPDRPPVPLMWVCVG